MIRRAIAVSLPAAGLLIPEPPRASNLVVDTRHLVVSDATGKMSDEQLKRSADQAQALSSAFSPSGPQTPG